MSFGFPAYYRATRPLINSRHASREAVVYALGVLGWEYFEFDNGTFAVEVSLNWLSWGERMTISLAEPNTITVESECTMPTQCFDWGKNKKNVMQFLTHFEGKELRDAKLPDREPNFLDASGRSPLDRLIDEGVVPMEKR